MEGSNDTPPASKHMLHVHADHLLQRLINHQNPNILPWVKKKKKNQESEVSTTNVFPVKCICNKYK